jgi:hypothetical protein
MSETSKPSADPADLYAPVLRRMVEICLTDSAVRFGAALAQAKMELNVPVLPQEIEAAMYRAAFKVVTSGFPSSIKA